MSSVIDALIAAAREKGRKEWIEERQELDRKLLTGSFFTPIDEVWKKIKVAPDEFRGAFEKLRRESKYYERVAEYDAIVKNAKRPADSGNRFEDALATMAIQDESDRGKATQGIVKTKKSRRRSRRGAANSAPPLEDVDEHSHSEIRRSSPSTLLDDTAGRVGCLAPEGSQASSDVDFDNPDFNGKIPSSRAHLVPESYCRYPFAISCQAVCGVDLERYEIERFADGMVNSDTNFLRTPTCHGVMFEANPCWIFVPIVTKDFLKNWQKDEGYEVLAIAGGFDWVSNEIAYETLCTKRYHDADDDGGDYLKRSKCSVADLRSAKERLAETAMALADSLVNEGASGISPLEYLKVRGGREFEILQATAKCIQTNRGVFVPELTFEDEDAFGGVEVFKFYLDKDKTDCVPDPLLLLIKATINWSWRCSQQLLPACGPVLSEEEGEEVSVTTPIPDIITSNAVPVTPDSDQKWPDENWTGDDWTL